MITVKQILEQYNLATDNATANENKLAELSDAGLFESSKLPMIKRSLNKNVNEMTEAEKKTLKYLLESLMTHILVEKNQKVDKTAYPSDKDMPTVIILKRKAIRVFPDNQKIGLYYSQALDRYISIPFGSNAKDLSPQLNEESDFQRRQREKKEKEKEKETGRTGRFIRTLMPKTETETRTSSVANLTTSVPSVSREKTENSDKKATPWGDREVIAITPEMREKAARESFKGGNLAAQIGGRIGLAAARAAEKTPLRSRTKVIYGEPIKESFHNNLQIIREKRELNEGKVSDFAYGDLNDTSWSSLGKDLTPGLGTARAAERTRQNFSAGNYGSAALHGLDTAVSGLSDAALATGIGSAASAALQTGRAAVKTGVKAISGLGKAAKGTETATDAVKAAKAAEVKARYDRRFGTRTQRFARGAGRVAKGALGVAALGASALGSAASDVKKPTSGEYEFTKTAGAKISDAPQTQTLGSGGLVAARDQARLYPNFPGTPRQNVYESNNLNTLKQIVENNIPSHTIQIGEETITINKSIAKKVVKLHESLNKTNKNKLERMLNEDITSLTKVINFAIKQ